MKLQSFCLFQNMNFIKYIIKSTDAKIFQSDIHEKAIISVLVRSISNLKISLLATSSRVKYCAISLQLTVGFMDNHAVNTEKGCCYFYL